MKKLVFLTATRAEYGKIKAILEHLQKKGDVEFHIFVTGMHMLEKFGYTYREIIKDGFSNVVLDEDYLYSPKMDMCMSYVMASFSRFVRSINPDMIIVHGDRLDAFAGAVVGAFNHILVAHLEGGELSGTIDESIRHAVSKLSHLHFVANDEAKRRLMQLGESEETIHIIGSPDIDVMLDTEKLDSLDSVLKHYDIPFRDYGILLYHPVHSEIQNIQIYIKTVVESLIHSDKNFIVIYPNNDPGNESIRAEYIRLHSHPHFRVLPSLRFERFLVLLKHASFIIGNSSAGVREACVYGVPAIDIGSRQQARYNVDPLKNIIHVQPDKEEICKAISDAHNHSIQCMHFGAGGSAEAFYNLIHDPALWETPLQKRFMDLELSNV